MPINKYNEWLREAYLQAQKSLNEGGLPIGSVLVDGKGQIVAKGHNMRVQNGDPTAHAEVLVIRQAAAARCNTRLPDCDLYVTLEPCALCATAIAFARLRKVVFGAYDPKGGGVEHGPRIFDQPTTHHAPEVIGGVMEMDCAAIVRGFFAKRRQ